MLHTLLFSETLGDIAAKSQYGPLPFLLVFEAAAVEYAGTGRARNTARENATELLRMAMAIGFLSYNEDPKELKVALLDAGVTSSDDFGVVVEKIVAEGIMTNDLYSGENNFGDIFDIKTLEKFLAQDRTVLMIAARKNSKAPLMKWTLRVSVLLLIIGLLTDIGSPYLEIFSITGILCGIVLGEWERKWRTNKALEKTLA